MSEAVLRLKIVLVDTEPPNLQRTRFESIAERKLRRQLTEDGNVEISGRDLL